jgi:multidrug efflux pump subunit AcrB
VYRNVLGWTVDRPWVSVVFALFLVVSLALFPLLGMDFFPQVALSGQIETMKESYSGLFSGMALAVILVFLLLVINFQSWIDPLIVLSAVPFALGGAVWMLFLSQTHISVPALMGTLMCIGLTTANSILVVTFANQRTMRGVDARTAAIEAGYTRLRPVLMAP